MGRKFLVCIFIRLREMRNLLRIIVLHSLVHFVWYLSLHRIGKFVYLLDFIYDKSCLSFFNHTYFDSPHLLKKNFDYII